MSKEEKTRRRRASSIGNINLGDNAVPSLTTRKSNAQQRKSSSARINLINKKGSSDWGLVKKIGLSLVELSSRHTWLPFLVSLVAIHGSYLLSNNHTPSNPLHKFVDLSYKIEGTNPPMYGKGWKDFCFVFYFMIFFSFYREFLMQALLKPLASKLGITRESKVRRFMEQSYSMCYYGFSGPLGLYIMAGMPLWYFNTTEFYITYPHKSHEYLFKYYYLGQAAFWSQQAVVLMLQLEKPRKDFKELVIHHIITIALIYCSYRFHFTWMGLAVYITMDISDFFLALSKTLNYVDSAYTGPAFMFFVGVWFYLRHWLNVKILWSVLTEFRTVGPFELNWITQQYKCWISQPIVFSLIFALQLVNLYWFVLILRILYRHIFLDVTKDERSDDESEEEAQVEPSKKEE
ncbi:Ceramide synthase component [Komagataella phaffii CBS 7435]|uniref:Ceramide synthase component, involved in synthesis of ceramide n=2 Tax=Komagataella phaffii TaxID=460519 RepID=C4QWW1_KOMPG|nr:Ceramide synthase component, involved in synthesis of ceramide [Komagataella phaffii GS115]AOA61407.1 GQ67_02941T0 [Komagataella phaffii]CAH2446527.1 Ceramide synthase component [Komagataella phaffii CBS 7435]AOA66435.1 GQ68_02306T0 [Komagataella phaffii GS115]CAY67734.1 Ceramide synthase component, involved in synthesis of ceramide [Komagataella phaffii GS115]CCA36821.1 Ceramide synthase component [Komagataella phaffii CBS 7435]